MTPNAAAGIFKPSTLSKPNSNVPNIKWTTELGEGHAGPAVYKGLVYVMDYDEQKKADMLRCFALKDGKEVWRRWYNININHQYGRRFQRLNKGWICNNANPKSVFR